MVDTFLVIESVITGDDDKLTISIWVKNRNYLLVHQINVLINSKKVDFAVLRLFALRGTLYRLPG
jgi:hypothetical protein